MNLRSLKKGDLILVEHDGTGILDPQNPIEAGSRIWIVTKRNRYGLCGKRVNDMVGGSLPYGYKPFPFRKISKEEAIQLLLECP